MFVSAPQGIFRNVQNIFSKVIANDGVLYTNLDTFKDKI